VSQCSCGSRSPKDRFGGLRINTLPPPVLADRAKADPIAYRLKRLNKDADKFRAVLTLLYHLTGKRYRSLPLVDL